MGLPIAILNWIVAGLWFWVAVTYANAGSSGLATFYVVIGGIWVFTGMMWLFSDL